jgi:dienelactone hydrolase
VLAAALLLAVSARAAPLPAPGEKFAVEVAGVSTGPARTDYLLKFPSAQKSPWPANDTVWAHLSVPDSAKGGGAPAVLVLPVMAAPNVWIETRFVDRFARDGFVVMWVEMPTQFRRRPHQSMPSGQVFLARTAKGLARNFRQSISDARRALGVLRARPEVDKDRVALFGISLGAIVGSVVWSMDSRPAAGVFLMGGADFPDLVMKGSLTGPFARKMEIKPGELEAAWAGLDPLDYKDANKGKKAFLINVNSDTVIPRANALKLKEAFPDSTQRWLPLGHYTAILHLVWLPRWVSGRLRELLDGKKTIKSGQTP